MTRNGKRLLWIAASFFAVSIVTRIGLALFSGETYSAGEWFRFMAIGLVFDLAVVPWFLLPWVLYGAVMPDFLNFPRLRKSEALWAAAWGTAYLTLFTVVAVGEFVFWNEFGSRFDFIAVDYLVYTHEVIGNIRESYPINWWLAGVIAVCAVVAWFTWPRHRNDVRTGWRSRVGHVASVAIALVAAWFLVNENLAETKSNHYVEQLATNGIYDFGHAYNNNELDYDRYYPQLPTAELNTGIRSLVRQTNATFKSDQGIHRDVAATGPERKVNIVLISVESLSAEYLGHFGNNQGLTPNLDRMADEGLLFTNLYATGTRTVRGLEALSVGTPPTPGQSIVRRPKSDHLETLGEELKEHGWKAYWMYGDYGFFDNMNAYFGSNDYTIVDRTDLDNEGVKIHSENIWGVADEDLFTMAMNNFDRAHARGDRFFAHIMTTSNHRPYTFPKNRVDLPQKHREGAVKYTDWAIGDFIKRSRDKPWFDNTVFIILADHTAKAAGKTDLPPARYHIPMIWYAPKLIKSAVMDRLMSQMDVPPTLLGWLGLDYSSRFFGYDMFKLEPGRERAFISTYQKLGYLKDGRLVVLDVNKKPIVVPGLPGTPASRRTTSDQELIREAITWYQTASRYFNDGELKDDPDNQTAAHGFGS